VLKTFKKKAAPQQLSEGNGSDSTANLTLMTVTHTAANHHLHHEKH
jgi:hypothetical protein